MGSVSIEQIERRTDSSAFASPLYLTFRDSESRAPLVSENVETDRAVGVDVGVVDLRGERDLRGLEGVVGGEGERAGDRVSTRQTTLWSLATATYRKKTPPEYGESDWSH